MLEPLVDLPDGVIGFEAVGEIHSADYDTTLRPAVEAASTAGVRLVYVLGDRFEGYSSGATWEDAKLGLGHLKDWKRTALVSDVEWIEHFASMFGWMMPGKFRLFPLAELPEAIAWAGADDD
ncbi:MAG: STAS/SEC14 domain-containing protein [Acidimicrobiia bacterium]